MNTTNAMSHPVNVMNEASRQIANSEFDKAIVALTNSLKTLKEIMARDRKIAIPSQRNGLKDITYDSSSSSSPDTFEYGFCSSPASSSFLKTGVAGEGRQSTCINESESFVCGSVGDNISKPSVTQHDLQMSIFRDPIMVEGICFRVALNEELCEELSHVAIYNLALAHHLKSVELASSSKLHLRMVYLRKALSLYEHSHQILRNRRINVTVPAIHSMALVSNIGQIHHALGDKDKAKMCLQYLLSAMMYVIDSGMFATLGKSMDGFVDLIMPLFVTDNPARAA
eukprot:jgi/Psemu1/291689/fgenesh1_pg.777_\